MNNLGLTIAMLLFSSCLTLNKKSQIDGKSQSKKVEYKYEFNIYSYEQYQTVLKKGGPIIEKMKSPHSDIAIRTDSIVIITIIDKIIHKDTILNPFIDGQIKR